MAYKMEGDIGGGSRSGVSAAVWLLLVWSQKSRDFAAYETDEGARKQLVGLPSGVLKVVVWVSQHIKESLYQFFILEDFLMVFRGVEPSVSHYVLYELFVVLIISNIGDLKASGAVSLIRLEVNPETSGPSCEGDGPLVRLTCLVGGDGRS